jgi:arylsulfatase A-like enzyme
VSKVPWYFADAFSTLAQIGQASEMVPDDLDGVSVLPTILGKDQPELEDRPIYWEAHKFFGFYQVVRKGDWKLIRWTRQGPRLHPLGDVDPVLPDEQYPMLELFNLRTDHREEENLAERESVRTDELLSLLDSAEAHLEDPEWPVTEAEKQVMGWVGK